MSRRRTTWSLVLAAGLALGARPATPTEAAEASLFHITLERSVPGEAASVSGPVSEVRLFFSGAPLMRGASIRVVNSARSLQRSTPPAADATDPKQLYVQMTPPLGEGTYVVQWRCIADDGHVMRGDFTFTVTAE